MPDQKDRARHMAYSLGEVIAQDEMARRHQAERELERLADRLRREGFDPDQLAEALATGREWNEAAIIDAVMALRASLESPDGWRYRCH